MKYKKIVFPRDGAAHDNVIEWWYFNGHLKDGNGNGYAFMDCLFKAKPKEVKLPFLKKIPLKNAYFAHSLLSDIKDNVFYSSVQPLSILSRDSFSKPLFFVNYSHPSLGGYLNYEIEEIDGFKYRIKSEFFDLTLSSTKKPLLEGGRGFIDLNSKQTFYYSLTNLETEGYVTVNGKRIKVKGKSWMDHQWADVPYSKDKWSWFSIQLDNNTEMVCFEYGDKKKKTYLASISYANGRVAHASDLSLTPLGQVWESKRTGAKYPLSWRIQVPSKRIDLVVSPLMKEQEIIFGPINYWEGPLKVTGKVNNKKVAGKGFSELVGYPTTKSFVEFYEPELRKIEKIVKRDLSEWVGHTISGKPGFAADRRK
ncbi:MAG: hypothetical protein KAW41_00980 [Candidatus Diapherotrites archaeon]|nr:hypothetical protein [Candidatus Diapherotrites archaeon]